MKIEQSYLWVATRFSSHVLLIERSTPMLLSSIGSMASTPDCVKPDFSEFASQIASNPLTET